MLKQTMKTISVLSLLAIVLVMLPAAGATAQTPIQVNGLFYGDGDVNNYVHLGQNPGRGDLYYYVDGTTLYVAVMVDPDVNDNVFGDMQRTEDQAYVKKVNWKGQSNQHIASALVNSENLTMNFECGAQSWTWIQDYAYDANRDKDPNGKDWLSDPLGNDGSGTWPSVLNQSSSSFAWNMNNTTWNVTVGGRTGVDNWKSVDDLANNDPTDDDWSTYNSTYGWEWPLVYEMSLDLALCGTDPWHIEVISAHNSPPKTGSNDVPIKVYDFGDAPDSYGTTLANNGPRHELVNGGPILGFVTDAEGDGQPGSLVDGDDSSPSFGADDEDGVLGTDIILEPGQTYTLQVVGTANSYLDAWIDFNADGDFDDAGEQIATSLAMNGTLQNLSFTAPASTPFTTTYGRFRVSSAGGLDPTGPAADGEVEDYAFQVYDFGDAPDSTNHYGTDMSYTGAPGDTSVANFPTVGDPSLTGDPGMCHLLTSDGAFLGNGVSGEKDADLTPDADIPSNLDPPASDNDLDSDDGLTLPGSWQDSVQTIIKYKVTVPAGGADQTRYVNVWFDWNRDGDWADASVACRTSGSSDEHAVVNREVNVSPGSSVEFSSDITPCNPDPLDDEDAVWVRITLSDQPVSATDGSGPGTCYAEGETEDWYFTPQSPTSVGLASFGALADNNGVLVTWETAIELDLLGFNLERAESAEGPWTQVNVSLIASAAPGNPVGESYDFVDSSVQEGLTYYYRLISVDTSGVSTYHGPVSVLVPTIGEPLQPPSPAGVFRVYLPFVGR